MDFEQWFNQKSRWFESLLIRLAAIFLLLLLAGQSILTLPQARRFVSLVDRLEGSPYVPAGQAAPALLQEPPQDGHYIVLTAGELAGLKLNVLVNGSVVADFGESGTVTVLVRAGDDVELDGEMPKREIEVLVSAVSSGVTSPASGKRLIYNGIPQSIGNIDTGGDGGKNLPNQVR